VQRCPGCAHTASWDIVSVSDVPVFCNVLYASRPEAVAAPVGDIELVGCERCGLLYNLAFDEEKVAYSPDYENSLHHSPAFQRFATELVDRLVDSYDIRNTTVVEVGAGSGDFMAMLCEHGDNRGIGYDPSHDPDRTATVVSDRITIVPEPYPADRPVEGRLVSSRHVFEHLTDPVAVLSGIRRSIDQRDDVVLYLEVPDATYMLEAPAVWDLIYEHPLYWTEAALRTTVRRCGFSPLASGRSFADQYLWVDAGAGIVDPDSFPSTGDLARTRAASAGFGTRVRDLVDHWNVRLTDLATQGPVAMWGAGSKGVSLLSLIDDPGLVSAVVDLNPHKHGRFTPVGGSPVIAPESLDPDTAVVLVTNPLYVEEIGEDLDRRGFRSEVLLVA
jgi:hypothetical protein